jgi:hypothetical protein
VRRMKAQKPTKIDASFLYLCPNDNCKNEHWLFLREVKVKNFKIVCECGLAFKPKQIDELKIKFVRINKQKNITKQDSKMPVDLVSKCGKILEGYGCSESESLELMTKAYMNNPTNDALKLIESSLKLLEIKNV